VKKKLNLFLLSFFLQLFTAAQPTSYNFRNLTTNEGLSDGIVRSIAQDAYGFMWFGTSYGLNRFDGITVKTFFSKTGDSSSLISNYIVSLYCDTKGNLWVGTLKGLCRYDYASNSFIRYTAPVAFQINDIKQDKNGQTWFASDWGLWLVNEEKRSVSKFTGNGDTALQKKMYCSIRQIVESPGGDWYLATNKGIKIFNPLNNKYDEIRYDPQNPYTISGDLVSTLSFDSTGALWAACFSQYFLVNKIDLRNRTVKLYDHFIKKEKKWKNNYLNKIITDQKGRIWIISANSGLSLYNQSIDNFNDYMNVSYVSNTPSSNQNISICQGKDGVIWLGSGGYGISYFNPDKNLFSSIYPLTGKMEAGSDLWCRAACEDKEGNIWLGTGRGVIKYNRLNQNMILLANDEVNKPILHTNSVRSLLYDDVGDIWIGTAKGLNRYHPANGKMDFFDLKHGIQLGFFWMLAKDQQGEVWLGSASGLYRYERNKNHFDDLKKDSLLSGIAYKNIQALFLDSHNRLWIGILDLGVMMYDIDNKKTQLLTIKDSMISDTRISSFAEDKKGIIWIGSEDRLTAFDSERQTAQFFSGENGLPSNRTNNIMVDKLNRIWIGTSNGLCMLGADRKKIKRFDVNDGLLTNQFNEQAACQTKDGVFIYPAYKGFLVFKPEDYRPDNSVVPVYITSFKISGKEKDDRINPEDLKEVNLRHNQNFFNIEFAGLNFINPHQCTYTYKLEPFDEDWIFSNKREVNYTNVPAGDYVFRYKITSDNPNFTVPEKNLLVHIKGVFYKTWWFRLLALLLIAAS
jgi:ligand-binding sensor domain-containing protein